MKYTDRVYGESEIAEPVVLTLLQSQALQRLRDVDQSGYRPLWVKPDADVGEHDNSRFAHSLGVYLLLRRYGVPIEEQIAGLIHDVSHSAFSHCIDYALDEGSEKEHDYQDNLFDSYVRETEIPRILQQFGFDIDYILDDKNFPLKEKPLPDLCADRIDYSLRTAVVFGEISEQDKNQVLENLTTKNGEWIFKNPESAESYARLFLKLNKEYWAGLPSAIMLKTVGDCVKYALQKEYISHADLYTTDSIVIEKIKSVLPVDGELKKLWDRMNNKVSVQNNAADYDVSVFLKSRVVDSLYMDGELLRRLSDVVPEWSAVTKEELMPKQYFLKFGN